MVWFKLCQDGKSEMKRSFQIWKECNEKKSKTKSRIKQVLMKRYSGSVANAFAVWRNYTVALDKEVRLNMLAREFAHKHTMTTLFQGFRYGVRMVKARRQNRLFHLFKAWKDSLQHKKYMLNSHMATLRLLAENDNTLLKGCFDALKHNKEEEKCAKTEFVLVNEEVAMVESLNNEIADEQARVTHKRKQEAVETVKKMGCVSVKQYFLKWKWETVLYH